MRMRLSLIIILGLVVVGCSNTTNISFETPTIRHRDAMLPTSGSIKVAATRFKETPDNETLVSTGVPFGVGQLKSDKDITFFEGEKEIPIATKVLARWVYDDSIRSVLVQFRVNWEDKEKYRPLIMKWGEKRNTEDIAITEVTWEIPEAYISLPAKWLCDSEVAGELVPINEKNFSGYDKKLLSVYPGRRDDQYKGDLREDFYYDTTHVFYQIYARTGKPENFVSARKEAIRYRDNIIKDGPERGSTTYKKPRYIFVQAMRDDYLLTGDERSLEIAGYMAEYLKNNFNPEKAFFPKRASHYWTERFYAFPFLGVLTYYELTGKKEYLDIASQYMNNLYKTQRQWPKRGGFIHNLYAHDPQEGARRNEYGGSPFMTGLLLEPIIEYHKLTGSKIAKESIFMALDWLVKEGLTPERDSFYYMTADIPKREGGHPDLNLLVAHAFGYGYRISGYEREDFLEIGKRIFQHGVKSAYLRKRKHFNQNFRSSGHFLSYIKDAKKLDKDIPEEKKVIVKRGENSDIHPRLFFTKKDIPGLREKLRRAPFWLRDGVMEFADVSPYWKKKEFLSKREDIYDIMILGFVYQLFNDKDYARQVVKNMLNIGIRSDDDLEIFALGFDWCYDAMSDDERSIIVSKMEDAGVRMMKKDRFFRSFHNTMYQLSTSIAACGYALEGESEMAEEFIEFSEAQYKDAILMFNNIFIDGEWPEGMDYNRHIALPLVKYFEIVRSATGRDLYKECDWLLDNAYFVLYTTRPDRTFYRFADNDLPKITDWERAFLVRVASYYKDPYIQWYVNHVTKPKEIKAYGVIFRQIYDLLWYEAGLNEKSLEDLPKSKFFRGSGIVIARSGWGPKDTWFSFKCGDYFGDHCHLDNNSFTIYKSGDLAIDSGLYGDDFGSQHWTNYYSRTIAHNTVTIHDRREKFTGYKRERLANDGGQKIMLWQGILNDRVVPENYAYAEPALPLTWTEYQEKWETGDIKDYKLTDEYCYVKGDATKSYSDHKLEGFTREVVFIFPDYFIILDRVSSTRPDFEKKWLLHTGNEPLINEDEIVTIQDSGRLFCKVLSPSDALIDKVGGPGKEFLVGDRNYFHNGRIFEGNVPGDWRIEVRPLELKKDDIFMNFLYTSTIGNETKPKVEKIDTDEAIGVNLELEDVTWEVVFKKEDSDFLIKRIDHEK